MSDHTRIATRVKRRIGAIISAGVVAALFAVWVALRWPLLGFGFACVMMGYALSLTRYVNRLLIHVLPPFPDDVIDSHTRSRKVRGLVGRAEAAAGLTGIAQLYLVGQRDWVFPALLFVIGIYCLTVAMPGPASARYPGAAAMVLGAGLWVVLAIQGQTSTLTASGVMAAIASIIAANYGGFVRRDTERLLAEYHAQPHSWTEVWMTPGLDEVPDAEPAACDSLRPLGELAGTSPR
ncbi:MAG: hypothetical protein ACK5KO_11845 [Arachnia sp.]